MEEKIGELMEEVSGPILEEEECQLVQGETEHYNCDCSLFIQIVEISETSGCAEAMVVTRSKAKKGKEILEDEDDSDNIRWKEQQAVRTRVTKEVQEFQKDRVPPEDWNFVIRSLDDQGRKDSVGNIAKPQE